MRSKISSLLMMLVVALVAASCSHGRSDAQVSTDVQKEIGSDPAIPANSVAVQSASGVVTLTGVVESEQVRVAAANDAARIEGVKKVVNNLQVGVRAVTQAAPAAREQERTSKRAPTEGPKAKLVGSEKASEYGQSSQRPSDAEIAKDLTSTEVTPADAGQPASAPAPAAAPAVATVTPPAASKVTIPTGTALSIRLIDGLDSEKNQVGDTFRASLSTPIVIDDQVVLPKDADLEGRVVNVKSAGKFAGESNLTIELTSISVNGKSYNIQTDQWWKNGTGQGKKTAAKAGGGALLGAIIGGIASGGRGAAIGTVAGGAAGAGAAAATNKANQIKLAPEAQLNFALQSSLTVTPQSTNDRNAGRQQMNQ
ncbi:MAG TPA: BON domain-containing protein [Candidatus Koribacter sp.]|jgi:hypothetical protein